MDQIQLKNSFKFKQKKLKSKHSVCESDALQQAIIFKQIIVL